MSGGIETLVVAAAPVDDPDAYRSIIERAEVVIAVDGGADLCMEAGRDPDWLVGDLDSIDPEVLSKVRQSGAQILQLEREKDISDLDAALELCVREHALSPVVTAATGGRLDHTLAAVGSLAVNAALSPRLLEPGLEGWILSAEGSAVLRLAGVGTTVSVLPVLGDANVSLTGFRYPLERRWLRPLGSMGLSNVLVTEGAQIRVHVGVVLVLQHGTAAV